MLPAACDEAFILNGWFMLKFTKKLRMVMILNKKFKCLSKIEPIISNGINYFETNWLYCSCMLND